MESGTESGDDTPLQARAARAGSKRRRSYLGDSDSEDDPQPSGSATASKSGKRDGRFRFRGQVTYGEKGQEKHLCKVHDYARLMFERDADDTMKVVGITVYEACTKTQRQFLLKWTYQAKDDAHRKSSEDAEQQCLTVEEAQRLVSAKKAHLLHAETTYTSMSCPASTMEKKLKAAGAQSDSAVRHDMLRAALNAYEQSKSMDLKVTHFWDSRLRFDDKSKQSMTIQKSFLSFVLPAWLKGLSKDGVPASTGTQGGHADVPEDGTKKKPPNKNSRRLAQARTQRADILIAQASKLDETCFVLVPKARPRSERRAGQSTQADCEIYKCAVSKERDPMKAHWLERGFTEAQFDMFHPPGTTKGFKFRRCTICLHMWEIWSGSDTACPQCTENAHAAHQTGADSPRSRARSPSADMAHEHVTMAEGEERVDAAPATPASALLTAAATDSVMATPSPVKPASEFQGEPEADTIVPWDPDGVNIEELEDNDVEVDVEHCVSDPLPGGKRNVMDQLAVMPLTRRRHLSIFDDNGDADPSAWELQCPKAGSDHSCCLQRNGVRAKLVHGIQDIMVLTVAKMKCVKHNSFFLMTNPFIFKQLEDRNLNIDPHIVVLSLRTVLEKEVQEFVVAALAANFDFSGASRQWELTRRKCFSLWLKRNKKVAMLAQAQAQEPAEIVTEAEALLLESFGCDDQFDLESKLQQLLTKHPTVTPNCRMFIEELKYARVVLGLDDNRPSISRKVVSPIFFHFAATELPVMRREQQGEVRAHRGAKEAFDQTYYGVASLSGASADARTVSNASKMQPHRASLLTGTVEGGYVVVAEPVPNDGQEYVAMAAEALQGVPPRDGMFNQEFHDSVSDGGPMGKFTQIMCTDHVAQNIHLWSKIAESVFRACVERGVPIEVPTEEIPDESDTMYAFGVSTVKLKRPATLEDFQDPEFIKVVKRLVCSCQDIYHVLDRIMRQVSKSSQDYHAFRGRLSEILKAASPASSTVIEGDTPADLIQKASLEAKHLSQQLLGLIAEFQTRITVTTKQERLHTCMEQLGHCYQLQGRPALERDLAEGSQGSDAELEPCQYNQAKRYRFVSSADFSPNTDFGGTYDQALSLLTSQGWFYKLPAVPENEALCQLMHACSSGANQDVIEEMFRQCPSSLYCRIPQRSPAWFALRKRLLITASTAWVCLGLPLIPSRGKGLLRSFHAPTYRKGPAKFIIAVHVMRGDIGGFDDTSGIEHVLGEQHVSGGEQHPGSAVAMEFGTSKEPYVIEAAMRACPWLIETCLVAETGLYSCDSSERPINEIITYRGAEHTVMSLMGASPDAVLTDAGGRVVAVIEAKTRCPFSFRGDQWVYSPDVKAMRRDLIDPSHLLQVQLQMHATGAEDGYLVSWSRTDLTVFSLKYSPQLIHAVARVMKHVFELYVAVEKLPNFPSDANQLPEPLRAAWVDLHSKMADQVACFKTVELAPGYEHRLNTVAQPMWRRWRPSDADESDSDSDHAEPGLASGNRHLVATIRNQARTVNVCGLISNRMVPAVQGTTPNENFHRALKKHMRTMGGGHTFGTLKMCIAFRQYIYNEVKLEREDPSRSLRRLLQWNGDVQACTSTRVQKWDAVWLQERGFKPKVTHEHSWTPSEQAKLIEGLIQYASGENVPHRGGDVLHFLQHHVMERRFSKKACKRMVMQQHALLMRSGAIPQTPSVESEDEQVPEEEGDDCSADEAVLPRPDTTIEMLCDM